MVRSCLMSLLSNRLARGRIHYGWYVAGIEINGELWDLDRDRGNVYQLSREDSDRLEKLSEKF